MVVGTAGAVAGILDAQRTITKSLEPLTNENIEARVQEANKQFNRAGIKGGLALASAATALGLSVYTDFKYEFPVSDAVVLVGCTYGMIQVLKGYSSLYTSNESSRILRQRQSS
ncbi:MAG TPA: hypothetical protein VJJ52_00615 [Candidatus Nanoarchaeia archaeon]|nr:hypothetical protein [Candidatus Nanoarchaeia archaeon]